MNGDIDWNLIKSFVTVAETGSLSAAARKLSASQPTLGRHIGELEQALGVTLFRRGRRGYALTEAGSTLFERGKAVSEQASAFSLLALGSVEAIEGTVRIAASEVVAAYVLPEHDGAARHRGTRHRGRDRRLEPGREPAAPRRRHRHPHGQAGAERAGGAQGLPTFRSAPARPNPISTGAAGRCEPADLVGHDLIGFDRSDEIIRGFTQLGIPLTRSTFRFRTDNQIVLWEAVRAGNGIGFGQEPLADRDPLVEKVLPGLPLPTCRCGWRCTATCAPACASAAWRIFSTRS